MQYDSANGIETKPVLNHEEHCRRLPLMIVMNEVADLPHIQAWMESPTPHKNLVREGGRTFREYREQGGSPEARTCSNILIRAWTYRPGRKAPDGRSVNVGSQPAWDLQRVHLRWFDSWRNFPRYAGNQNAGHPFASDAETKRTPQAMLHDGERLSPPVLAVTLH